MKHQPKPPVTSPDELLLRQACCQAEEGLHAALAAGYRRGLRRVNLRHAAVSVAVTLCLAAATLDLMGWLLPYTMDGGSRRERLAAYEMTQQMLYRL